MAPQTSEQSRRPADPAALDGLGDAIERLVPRLEEFLEADGPDLAVRDRAAWIAALDRDLPADGGGVDAVVDELARWVIPHGQRTPDPGFMAYIIGRATTATLAAGLAAQVAGHFRYFLTSFNFLEEQSLGWLAELCRIPGDAFGVYSSGGSTANLLAMGAARQASFERIGVDETVGSVRRDSGGFRAGMRDALDPASKRAKR